jgi:hypothetical protein
MAGNVRPPKYGNRYGRQKVEEVINLIVTANPTFAHITKMAGVCEKTLQRWYQQEWFLERLSLAYHRMYEPGNAILRQEYKNTVLALVNLRDNTSENSAVRLGAMRTLMEYSTNVHITDYYDEKLRKLEAKTIDAVPVITSEPQWVNNNNNWYADESSNTPN